MYYFNKIVYMKVDVTNIFMCPSHKKYYDITRSQNYDIFEHTDIADFENTSKVTFKIISNMHIHFSNTNHKIIQYE